MEFGLASNPTASASCFAHFHTSPNPQLDIQSRSQRSSGMEKEKRGGIKRPSPETTGPLVPPHDDR